MKSFFTPKEVSRIMDISYRKLEYWDNTNFIKPSYRRKLKYRLYTFTDLFQLKLASILRKKKFSIQRIRKIITNLRSLLPLTHYPLLDLTFLIENQNNVLIFNGDMILNEEAKVNYTRFRVRDFRNEVDSIFPYILKKGLVDEKPKI
jgi:DNA-binding transcriptional MerR regulator